MACGLSRIDWSAPWLLPWRERGERIAQQVALGISVAEACNEERLQTQHAQHNGAMCPVHFVPQDELPDGMAYEQFIFEHQQAMNFGP